MRSDWKITFFKPDIPGIFPILNGIRFAAEFSGDVVSFYMNPTEQKTSFLFLKREKEACFMACRL